MKSLLDSKAVCTILGIKPPTLSRMVHSNRIPFVLLSTGKKKMTVRFKEEELEAWIDRRSRGPAPKPKLNGEDDGDRAATTSYQHRLKGSF